MADETVCGGSVDIDDGRCDVSVVASDLEDRRVVS